jgi:feruloyl-CoA synthase
MMEVGLPAPGLEIKLVPNAEKLELRLKGPSITPGYWRMPDKTAECFDEEGFYRIGDALKFVDPDDVNKGFIFDGRVSEDFKLSTGTWVNFANVRGAIARAFAPYVRDAVLTGLDRNHIGVLLFLDPDAARRIEPLPWREQRYAGRRQIHFRRLNRRYRATPSSTMRASASG